MKKLLCLLMLFCLLPPAALAESPEAVTIVNTRYAARSEAITDAAYMELLMGLLTAPTEACTLPELPNSARTYEVHCRLDGQDNVIYTVYHDDLYNQAWLLTPSGETFSIGCDVPLLLQRTLYDSPDFSVPEEHRVLLAEHGWTIAFRSGCQEETLPTSLTASRTDPAALHFTWAHLFLQDAGYDITPYLGKTVQAYIYQLVEPVNRVAWKPSDVQFLQEGGTGGVLYSMRAAVLECEGEVIGAYLIAASWDGSNLMSLTGHTAIDLLGEDGVLPYLLAHEAPDAALAALTPEEVLQRYSETEDPSLKTLEGLLYALGTANDGGLYRSTISDAQTQSADPAVSIRAMGTDDGTYEVQTRSGETWYPQLVLESEETGWKIVSFYNTGY